MKITEKDSSKIAAGFKNKLKIVWQGLTAVKDGHPRRMVDAFIDNTIVREEVIHKIVEVPLLPEGVIKKQKKDKKKKKAKSKSSDSSDSKLSVDESELAEIKQDIKLLKSTIK